MIREYNSSHTLTHNILREIHRTEKILLSKEGQECHVTSIDEYLIDCYERAFQRNMGCRLPWSKANVGTKVKPVLESDGPCLYRHPML